MTRMSDETTIVDLDALLEAKMKAAKDKIQYRPIRLLGREWRVSTAPNAFTSLGAAGGDVRALSHMIAGAVHTDERDQFTNALMNADGIDDVVLLGIIEAFLEVVGERPTESPSDSSDGSEPKKDSKPKSPPA
jgi:hypothetical protein